MIKVERKWVVYKRYSEDVLNRISPHKNSFIQHIEYSLYRKPGDPGTTKMNKVSILMELSLRNDYH